MKTFSVMTVSKREGWFADTLDSIIKQTLQPEDWIIVTEVPILGHKKMNGDGWHVIPAPKQTRPSNLNASQNEGLRHITSDYVILLNDFIDLPEDCFEKLMALVDERTFVCVSPYNPDGSSDSRHTGVNKPRFIRPYEWEPMVGAAPMKMIRELGGYEEDLDNGWAWDNVHLAQRAAMLGAKFIIDESNRPKLLPHEQTSKLKMELNGQRCADSIAAIRAGKAPLKLHYL